MGARDCGQRERRPRLPCKWKCLRSELCPSLHGSHPLSLPPDSLGGGGGRPAFSSPHCLFWQSREPRSRLGIAIVGEPDSWASLSISVPGVLGLVTALPTLVGTGHPGQPGRAGDGRCTAPLRLLLPRKPTEGPQTPREKARPFPGNGFLHLYNVIGAVEKRGRWLYGNHIKFMGSRQARSSKGLQRGGGTSRGRKS